MKEHIHTIPVLEALREPGGCPFCVMRQKLDDDAIDFMMGPAYMDEHIREETNKTGFCEKHLQKMYAAQNRLGIALMLHTHVMQLSKDIDGITSGGLTLGSFFNRKPDASTPNRLYNHVNDLNKRCYVCEKVETTLNRYIETFFSLWAREAETRELTKALPGFCLPHFSALMSTAESALDKKKLQEFLETVLPIQQNALRQLEEDLDWFVTKFDYRNADAPWKNAKDAIPRAFDILVGKLS